MIRELSVTELFESLPALGVHTREQLLRFIDVRRIELAALSRIAEAVTEFDRLGLVSQPIEKLVHQDKSARASEIVLPAASNKPATEEIAVKTPARSNNLPNKQKSNSKRPRKSRDVNDTVTSAPRRRGRPPKSRPEATPADPTDSAPPARNCEPVDPAMEIGEVWRRYQADTTLENYRNQLVEKYFPIVKYNAERIWARLPDAVELDDLVSAGVFGLVDAIKAFDSTRGVKFETYCVPRIRGAMLDELRQMDWVPRLVRAKASKLKAANACVEARLGREPTINELAANLEINVSECEQMIREASAVNLISLNKKWFETDSQKDVREIDILEDQRSEDPTRRLDHLDSMRLLTKGLNRDERLIIILYYYEQLTMKEIGKTLELSESRVSQLHSAILNRLRERPDLEVA